MVCLLNGHTVYALVWNKWQEINPDISGAYTVCVYIHNNRGELAHYGETENTFYL